MYRENEKEQKATEEAERFVESKIGIEGEGISLDQYSPNRSISSGMFGGPMKYHEHD